MALTTRRDIPGAKSPPTPRASPAASGERTPLDRADRKRAALDWERFEAWCASNGIRLPASADDLAELVGAYITFLVATRRSIAIIARSLLRARRSTE